MTTFFGIFLPFCAILLATSALMLYGVFKKNRRFLIPWIIMGMLEIIICIINMLHFFIQVFPNMDVSEKNSASTILKICFKILIKFAIYYWCVVRDYYEKLGKPSNAIIDEPGKAESKV